MKHPSPCPACSAGRRDHTPAEIREHHPNRNPDCAACCASRLHDPDEYREFHAGKEGAK